MHPFLSFTCLLCSIALLPFSPPPQSCDYYSQNHHHSNESSNGTSNCSSNIAPSSFFSSYTTVACILHTVIGIKWKNVLRGLPPRLASLKNYHTRGVGIGGGATGARGPPLISSRQYKLTTKLLVELDSGYANHNAF